MGLLVPFQAKDLEINAKDGMIGMGEALKGKSGVSQIELSIDGQPIPQRGEK